MPRHLSFNVPFIGRLFLIPIAVLGLLSCGSEPSDSNSASTVGGNSNTQASQAGCTNQVAGIGATGKRWISAWGTTRSSGTAPVDTTVRNIVRVTTSGPALRVRLFNLSDQPIQISAASIGLREGVVGATLKQGSVKPLTFNCGQSFVTVPPKTETLYSDAIAYEVLDQADLAISFHVKGSGNPGEFGSAWSESYKLADGSGNKVADESGQGYGLIDGSRSPSVPGTPLTCNGCLVYAVRDVEVLTSDAHGAMVFLGSSSFHGYNTTQNSYRRVGDQISVRMGKEVPAGQRQTIVNRGIGGDTLFAATENRLARDVWDTVGVSSVVVWVTNDLSSKTADEVIANYEVLIAEAHARGVKVFCPTWLPGAQSMPANLNGDRKKLNEWILTSGKCDGVVDYAAMVEAPGGVTYLPQYNSGDFIHSNDAGHTLWAAGTPLARWLGLATTP